jgi:hypothetical protein
MPKRKPINHLGKLAIGLTILAHAAGAQSTSTYAQRLGWKKDDRVIMFHIDDAGMSRESNAGTAQALANGVATSASVMMPCHVDERLCRLSASKSRTGHRPAPHTHFGMERLPVGAIERGLSSTGAVGPPREFMGQCRRRGGPRNTPRNRNGDKRPARKSTHDGPGTNAPGYAYGRIVGICGLPRSLFAYSHKRTYPCPFPGRAFELG